MLDWIPVLETYANSADQVQMLQNAASDQGLHCLLTRISVLITLKLNIFTRNVKCKTKKNKKWTNPNEEDRQIHWSKKKGLE